MIYLIDGRSQTDVCSSMLFLFILCSTLYVEPRLFRTQRYNDGLLFSLRESSVDSLGLTILSWRFHRDDVTFQQPEWTKRMLNTHMGIIEPKCGIELLVVIPKKYKNQHGLSHLNFTLDSRESISILCNYASVAVGWERKPDSSSPPRPAFFYCPISPASNSDTRKQHEICDSLYSISTNFSLVVHGNSIDASTISGWFTSNSPKSRKLDNDSSSKSSLGVCTNAMHKTDESVPILQTFVMHHSSLGFNRIVVHDAYGSHEKYLKTPGGLLPPSLTYLNFTIWQILGRNIKKSSNPGNSIMVRERDQDKALTYTYCRFELSQLATSILIIDYDEMVYCPNALKTVKYQRKALLNAIKKSVNKRAETMTWHRSGLHQVLPLTNCSAPLQIYDRSYVTYSSIPNQTVDLVTTATITGAVANTSFHFDYSTAGAFRCFGSLSQKCSMRQPKNVKSMHHGLVCPFTDNHVSCSTNEYPNRGCKCLSVSQNDCELLHLNAAKCGGSSRLKQRGNGMDESDGDQSDIRSVRDKVTRLMISHKNFSATDAESIARKFEVLFSFHF